MTAPTFNNSEVIHGMKDYTTMTPREYSASRRSLPFGASMLQKASNPDWRKIGRGMIAAVDGDTGVPMICPGKVYAIEIHNGQIGFASYRRTALISSRPGTGSERTLKTSIITMSRLRSIATRRNIVAMNTVTRTRGMRWILTRFGNGPAI